MIINIHKETPEKRFVQKFIQSLQNGQLCLFPTDSGYAVGCSALSHKGLKKLYYFKRGVKRINMTLLVQNLTTINDFAFLPHSAFRYLKKKLPGPFTFIFECSNMGQKTLKIKREEIGIKMPNTEFFKIFRELSDIPILTTSVKSDDEIFIDGEDIFNSIKSDIDLFLNQGQIEHLPSTVISYAQGDFELIREGAGNPD